MASSASTSGDSNSSSCSAGVSDEVFVLNSTDLPLQTGVLRNRDLLRGVLQRIVQAAGEVGAGRVRNICRSWRSVLSDSDPLLLASTHRRRRLHEKPPPRSNRRGGGRDGMPPPRRRSGRAGRKFAESRMLCY